MKNTELTLEGDGTLSALQERGDLFHHLVQPRYSLKRVLGKLKQVYSLFSVLFVNQFSQLCFCVLELVYIFSMFVLSHKHSIVSAGLDLTAIPLAQGQQFFVLVV